MRRSINKLVLSGLIIILFFLSQAMLAPWVAPHDPYQIHLQHKLEKAGDIFPLGTDYLGRCVLSRLIYGIRITLLGSFGIGAAVSVAGLLLGVVSGYFGRTADRLLTVVMDIFLSVPDLVWMLAIIGIWGASMFNLLLALVLTHWAGYARITRCMVWEIREKNYLLAAQTMGTSWMKILRKHVLPNIIPRLLILVTMDMGKFILTIAGFSFLGLGVQPPEPEWGAMLSEGKNYIQSHPTLLIFPGTCIMLLVAGFNLLGEGLRDYLDPRHP